MAKRKLFTPLQIENLKPAPAGKRVDHMEPGTPGFGVRVTETGAKSYILVARFPGSPNPTRRRIGDASKMPLAAARKKAKDWHELIAIGKDPADEERKAKDAEARERRNTFAAAIEDYLDEQVKQQRRGAKVEREIRRHLLPEWRDRPVTDIARDDVSALVRAVARKSGLYQAHNVFGHVRTFYNWAIASGSYGLEASPCDRLKASALAGGTKKPRQRELSDDELRAFWRASGRLGYPFGPMFRLLLLTGQRRSEVAEAQWPEFHPELVKIVRQYQDAVAIARANDQPAPPPIDWSKVPAAAKLWTVPPERFKSDSAHLVPLSDDACAILATLPRFKRGPYLFSTTFGAKPVSGFSKAKARLDARMLRALKAMARARGDDPAAVELPRFVNHDDRRTVRTRLSALKVSDVVAEMVIGHGRKGLQRVYDQHKYVDEMREALDLWAGKLRSIVEPPPSNVVRLEARAS